MSSGYDSIDTHLRTRRMRDLEYGCFELELQRYRSKHGANVATTRCQGVGGVYAKLWSLRQLIENRIQICVDDIEGLLTSQKLSCTDVCELTYGVDRVVAIAWIELESINNVTKDGIGSGRRSSVVGQDHRDARQDYAFKSAFVVVKC